MSYKFSPTNYVEFDGVKFAYREIGRKGGVPLVLLHHFTAVIDEWDPKIVDGLAQRHHVIVFDNRGVGGSGGETPHSIYEMAEDAASFIRTLGHEQVDLLGFSMGGYIAQALTIAHPKLVRKLVLAGTGPAGIAKTSGPFARTQEVRAQAVALEKHPKHFLFFPQTEAGQIAANDFLSRIGERTVDRVKPTSEKTVEAHVAAITAWAKEDEARTSEIQQAVLIVNGDDDVMVPTHRSFDLHRLIKNSTLSIYPEAGHGGIFQYHEIFVQQALAFLAK